MALWIPVGLFILWRYYVNKAALSGELTPERQAAYTMAMSFARDPDKLRVLADAFDDAGLKEQARSLRKRAALPTLPKNVQEARAKALKAALSSVDVKAIRALADVFESQGMGASASMLRDYAQGLEQAENIHPVQLTPQNPPATPPEEQLPHPEHQVPPTEAGQNMAAPVPMDATPAPVPPMPHGEFGLGTVIPSTYPAPMQPDVPGPIEEHIPPPIQR
jgi:hypothetical protein